MFHNVASTDWFREEIMVGVRLGSCGGVGGGVGVEGASGGGFVLL